jgi:redox-sensitive bicupin YhaK (pirin superfamily)
MLENTAASLVAQLEQPVDLVERQLVTVVRGRPTSDGLFVMNTTDEIRQAVDDFKAGRF